MASPAAPCLWDADHVPSVSSLPRDPDWSTCQRRGRSWQGAPAPALGACGSVPCSQVCSRPSGGPLLRVSAPSLLSGSPALSAPVLPSAAQFISSFTQPDWSSQSALPYLFSRAAPSGHRETGTRPCPPQGLWVPGGS